MGGYARLRSKKTGRAWQPVRKCSPKEVSLDEGLPVPLEKLRPLCQDQPRAVAKDKSANLKKIIRQNGEKVAELIPRLEL